MIESVQWEEGARLFFRVCAFRGCASIKERAPIFVLSSALKVQLDVHREFFGLFRVKHLLKGGEHTSRGVLVVSIAIFPTT